MKKFLLSMMMSAMVMSASSCTNVSETDFDNQKPETEHPDEQPKGKSNILFVYYSWSGVTKGVAEKVNQMIGCDTYELVPAVPYSSDMYETSDRAKEERESGNLPELSGELPDLSEYDLILVGGPVWSNTLASPVMTYLSQTDFLGKNVAPLWTYAGNEGQYRDNFNEQVRNANIVEGLGLAHASSLSETELEERLENWLEKIGANRHTDKIKIAVGEHIVDAELNGSEAAEQFKAMLPVTISMTRMGGHEYYGRLPQSFEEKGETQTGYEVGDLAFWTPGDLFAIYFNTTNNAPEGLLILGKIISDIKIFENLGNPEEMRIELAD